MTWEEHRQKLRHERIEAEARSVELRKVLDQINPLMNSLNKLAPRPFFGSKREREKWETWSGIRERVLSALRAPAGIDREIESLNRREQEERDRKAKESADVERKKQVAQITDKAIAWLLERGKKLGEDFSSADAIAVADGIAFDEEAKRQSDKPGFIGFYGQNCDGPCSGWDKKSNRCDCGNRRVSWTQGDGHSFEKPNIYAEAY